jgi:hypothetical protein
MNENAVCISPINQQTTSFICHFSFASLVQHLVLANLHCFHLLILNGAVYSGEMEEKVAYRHQTVVAVQI